MSHDRDRPATIARGLVSAGPSEGGGAGAGSPTG
jgi:hypothetical protein